MHRKRNDSKSKPGKLPSPLTFPVLPSAFLMAAPSTLPCTQIAARQKVHRSLSRLGLFQSLVTLTCSLLVHLRCCSLSLLREHLGRSPMGDQTGHAGSSAPLTPPPADDHRP